MSPDVLDGLPQRTVDKMMIWQGVEGKTRKKARDDQDAETRAAVRDRKAGY